MSDHPPVSAPRASAERLWDRPRFQNWVAVARVHVLWEHHFAAKMTRHGVKIAQFDILANLLREPGMTQQRLAEKLFVGRSNLSMTLPEMERLGWLIREGDPNDRRLRRLTLTSEGIMKAEIGFAAQNEILDEMMGVLSDEECNALGDSMRRMAEYLRKTLPKG